MLFVLFVTGCRGRYARSFTYKLHNPQNSDQSSTLHSMPDGALLMVATRNEQPRQVWNLLRITDWETSHPREDKLDVDVGPNEELLREEDKYDHSGQLLMDPGGNYLVVRLSQDADSSNLNPESAKPPRSVLNISIFKGSSFSAASRSPILRWPLPIWVSVRREHQRVLHCMNLHKNFTGIYHPGPPTNISTGAGLEELQCINRILSKMPNTAGATAHS
jgi:hypothetical protein